MLMMACCTITYLCISHFAPYIYSYDLAEVQDVSDMLAEELSWASKKEAPYYIQTFNDMFVREYNDEYAFYLFRSSGEEIDLSWTDADTGGEIDPSWPDVLTGRQIEDYKGTDMTKEYEVSFADSGETYILLFAQKTDKESQIVLALRATLPILSVIVILVSVIAALFYTWYMTMPIKRVSRLSRQMADMDFTGLCPVGRTDEIGVLSDSLNDLSGKLAAALSELREANQKLQADIDRERQLERQRIAFFRLLPMS